MVKLWPSRRSEALVVLWHGDTQAPREGRLNDVRRACKDARATLLLLSATDSGALATIAAASRGHVRYLISTEDCLWFPDGWITTLLSELATPTAPPVCCVRVEPKHCVPAPKWVDAFAFRSLAYSWFGPIKNRCHPGDVAIAVPFGVRLAAFSPAERAIPAAADKVDCRADDQLWSAISGHLDVVGVSEVCCRREIPSVATTPSALFGTAFTQGRALARTDRRAHLLSWREPDGERCLDPSTYFDRGYVLNYYYGQLVELAGSPADAVAVLAARVAVLKWNGHVDILAPELAHWLRANDWAYVPPFFLGTLRTTTSVTRFVSGTDR